MKWMEEHLGSDTGEALIEIGKTKGAHYRFGYLQRIFKERMKEQLDLETEYGMTQQVQRLHIFAILGGDHALH